jgi:hypothetical protein
MAEIVEFKRNISMRGNYDCIQDLSTDNFSGRYVRESDYTELLERHRRLVGAVESYVMSYPLSNIDSLEAALAEEVDDGL